MRRLLSSIAVVAALVVVQADRANAAIITPSSISGQGSYTNSESLTIGSTFPWEEACWTASTNAYWRNEEGANGVTFTIDYGSVRTIQNQVVSVNNNDSYQIQYSTDGSTYSGLFDIAVGDGEIGFGMDTFSTVAGVPEYDSDVHIASAEAGYLKIFATGGDRLYFMGELQAFGPTPIHENP